jgi:hypothetical protein
MIREGGNRELTPSPALGTFLDSFRLRCRQSCFSLEKTMFVDRLSEMLPFVALGALGVVNLVAAIGAWRYAQGRRAQIGALRATARSARAARAAARGAQDAARRARA